MPLSDEVQVKIAITELSGKTLDTFLLEDLRPEICIEGPEIRYFDRDACRRLANLFGFRRLPVTFHAPFLRLDPGSPDRPSRDYAKDYLERTVRLAEYFQPLTVVCHAGPLYGMNATEQEQWNERSLPIWQWMEQACQDIGAVLTLENVLHDQPATMAPLFAELDHARWCFDVGHVHAFSKVDQSEWTDALGSQLGQLHLHDNHGTGDQHLPVGHGSVQYSRLMTSLAPLPRPVATTMEVHYRHELAASVEYLEPLWPWPL
ncbi:MAG: sugar phosphate isomerase/epimerase [Proteobacteria bacterium]|nr:sugar phosphate isomerase/epimerase [Pseudomonadota bacterium]MBU1612595.1 sugar phosphate isomerase/epimerase [Pseudomonadota bacterium]